jgi:hypothetical protein
MEIDFHFGVTYVVARLADFSDAEAQIIATSSQYVDDTANRGELIFETGEMYYRSITSHKKDYRILFQCEERLVWISFHFLPGNVSSGLHADAFYDKIVCWPNSDVAKAMVANCISKKHRKFHLHQLGITAHVFADTWAHKGFSGIKHNQNKATDIGLEDPDEECTRGLRESIRPWLNSFLDCAFPMGHAAVLHYPDHPFRRWSYLDDYGNKVERDNPADFLVAADELCKVFRRYRQDKADQDVQVEGLRDPDKKIIQEKLKDITGDDGEVRNAAWLRAVRDGVFTFGKADPQYKPSGRDSWKHKALGTLNGEFAYGENFEYKPEFLNSDWKQFHDAAQAHQFEVLREILPQFEICVI